MGSAWLHWYSDYGWSSSCSLPGAWPPPGIPVGALGIHPLWRPLLKAVSCGQLFWEQELRCLGSQGPLGRRSRGQGQQCCSGPHLGWAACIASAPGTKTLSRGLWGCELKELPLSIPALGFREHDTGSTFFFFKATVMKTNSIFHSGRGWGRVYTCP